MMEDEDPKRTSVTIKPMPYHCVGQIGEMGTSLLITECKLFHFIGVESVVAMKEEGKRGTTNRKWKIHT